MKRSLEKQCKPLKEDKAKARRSGKSSNEFLYLSCFYLG